MTQKRRTSCSNPYWKTRSSTASNRPTAPGMITVFTKLNKSSIYIRIENPYTPPESSENAKPHKGNSMALHNLKERLTLMYDNDAKIQSRQLDGIFRVDIRLPYRKKASDVNRLFG